MIELGGNIKLVGFKDLDPSQLIVVKKMIGTYAKKISQSNEFQELSLHLKAIHKNPEKDSNVKYELQAKVIIDGKPYNSEITDFNLFYAMDRVLTKLIDSCKEQ